MICTFVYIYVHVQGTLYWQSDIHVHSKDCRAEKKTIEVGIVKEFFGTGSIPPHFHQINSFATVSSSTSWSLRVINSSLKATHV